MSRNAAPASREWPDAGLGGRMNATMTPASANPADGGESQGQSGAPPGERLDGWKAIASYLGRDIRTVQRWELSENLPIHRLEHRQRATAYAYTGELDDWLAKRAPADSDPLPPSPVPPSTSRAWRTRALPLALSGIVVAVLLVVWTIRSNSTSQGGDTQIAEAYAAFAEGRALYASRQYRDASIALERAVSRDPAYGSAWAFLGKTYGRLSQPMWAGGKAASDRAGEASQRALQLAPGRAETHIALSLAARSGATSSAGGRKRNAPSNWTPVPRRLSRSWATPTAPMSMPAIGIRTRSWPSPTTAGRWSSRRTWSPRPATAPTT